MFEKIRQIVLDQHDIGPGEIAVEPALRVGKARARHDVAFWRGLGEGVGERRDPMRRDRHQDIDMGGRFDAVLVILGEFISTYRRRLRAKPFYAAPKSFCIYFST